METHPRQAERLWIHRRLSEHVRFSGSVGCFIPFIEPFAQSNERHSSRILYRNRSHKPFDGAFFFFANSKKKKKKKREEKKYNSLFRAVEAVKLSTRLFTQKGYNSDWCSGLRIKYANQDNYEKSSLQSCLAFFFPSGQRVDAGHKEASVLMPG